MDTVKQMIQLTGKYKYVAALVLIGLVLMAFPGSDTPQTPASMPVTVKEATMDTFGFLFLETGLKKSGRDREKEF